MSLFTSLYGSGAGAPIGTIVATPALINDDNWLPLTNSVYNRADYPELDVSKMLTFDGNSVVTGPTLASGSWKIFHVTGTVWYAHQYGASQSACARSTDNGATWSSGTLPQQPAAYWPVSYANGIFFQVRSDLTNNNLTYYTSTDGLSWTTRNTLPAPGGYYQNYSGVVYVNGRYIMLPTFAHSAAGGLWSLWSTDGISWTAVQVASGSGTNVSTALTYSSTFGRVDVSELLGLQLATVSTSPSGQFVSTDGLSWRNIQRYTFAMGQDTNLETGPNYAVTSNGAMSGNMQNICIGNHQRAWRKTNSSFSGHPLRKTNITVSNGLSEDNGFSLCRSLAGAYSQNTDLSASRLMYINTSGVVFWLDVNQTKFRAVAPLQDAELPLMGQTLYLKVR